MPLQQFNNFLISVLDITLQKYHSGPTQILRASEPVPVESLSKLSAAAVGFAVATRQKGRKSTSRKCYFLMFPCSGNVDQCNRSSQYGRR